MARAWMKEARENAGKTQAEVAAELNISEGYYSFIENGKRMQRLELGFADRLSKIFHVSLRHILDCENDYTAQTGP